MDHILSELSIIIHLSRVALHGMAHGFIELDKAVVHLIRLFSVLCSWFLFVCPLMPSLGTYHLTGISLILDVGYVFTVPAPDLGHRISPLSCLLLQCCAATAHCSRGIINSSVVYDTLSHLIITLCDSQDRHYYFYLTD